MPLAGLTVKDSSGLTVITPVIEASVQGPTPGSVPPELFVVVIVYV